MMQGEREKYQSAGGTDRDPTSPAEERMQPQRDLRRKGATIFPGAIRLMSQPKITSVGVLRGDSTKSP
ncbi:hypothetical protein TNCV_3631751 [Trichonephila clavipes]|nr:hypothetical protein TNCV_3631751 [Trichonephila clavipes]